MNSQSIKKYLLTCGLLLIPVFIWNVVFVSYLPPAFAPSEFWRDIPHVLVAVENSLRLVVFTLPFIMPLSVSSAQQRTRLVVFIAGNLVYFASWIVLIAMPDSLWSQSALGFLAPSYTPIIWFAGLALLGRRIFWGSFYRWWMYLALSGLFLVAHVTHAAIVYARNY